MNEKMQPKTKVSHRRWQHFNRGDYYYGEREARKRRLHPEQYQNEVNMSDVVDRLNEVIK